MHLRSKGDQASLCSEMMNANLSGSPGELLMHFATKPSRHTQNSLFLEQGSNLEMAGYLWKLPLLHWLLGPSLS